eukprot:2333954-Rhodomonas_salina.1
MLKAKKAQPRKNAPGAAAAQKTITKKQAPPKASLTEPTTIAGSKAEGQEEVKAAKQQPSKRKIVPDRPYLMMDLLQPGDFHTRELFKSSGQARFTAASKMIANVLGVGVSEDDVHVWEMKSKKGVLVVSWQLPGLDDAVASEHMRRLGTLMQTGGSGGLY